LGFYSLLILYLLYKDAIKETYKDALIKGIFPQKNITRSNNLRLWQYLARFMLTIIK